MNLNIRYYQTFVLVYESLSMSAAAEELYLTQPAVSRIIREMEEAYHTRFFLRQSGQLYRTQSGDKLYPYAVQLLSLVKQMDEVVREQKLTMKVHIGATSTLASYYLPDALAHYQRENGELECFIHTHTTDTLMDMIKKAQLDFAFVEGMCTTQECTVRPIMEEQLIFVTSDPDHVKSPLPLLIRDIGSEASQRLEQDLREMGIHYQIKGRFADTEGVKQCAARGLGVRLVPAGTVQGNADLKQCDLCAPNLTTTFSICYYKKKFIFPQLRQLMKHLEEYMAD